MNEIKYVRRRQNDGSLGPLEPAFPHEIVQMTPTEAMLFEAVAGLQEQIFILQAEKTEGVGE